MTYQSWFDQHYKQHKKIVDKLTIQRLTREEIVDYFDFDNMILKEPDFCPLYTDAKQCHDMKPLNYYLCTCPNFRFYDSGVVQTNNLTKYSNCSIGSTDGNISISDTAIHQDCSNCTIPHNKEYITKHFDLDWKNIMHFCKFK